MGTMEQQTKMVNYAVITLFYAVPEESAKHGDSRNGLLAKELHGIIRRSQPAILDLRCYPRKATTP